MGPGKESSFPTPYHALEEPALPMPGASLAIRRQLYAFSASWGLFVVISHNLWSPFFRAAVECPLMTHMNRSDVLSSAYCGDEATILSSAQRLESALVSVRTIAYVATGPIMGAMADRYGRVFVMQCSAALYTASLLLFWLAATLVPYAAAQEGVHSRLPLPLLVLASIVGGASTFSAPINALLAAHTPLPQQTAVYSAMMGFQGAAGVGGVLIAIGLLQLHPTEFSVHWLILATGASCAALLLLRLKQIADESHLASTTGGRGAGALAELGVLLGGLWITLAQSRMLQLLMLAEALLTAGLVGAISLMQSFMMAVYGWPQNGLLILSLCMIPPAICSFVLTTRVLQGAIGIGGVCFAGRVLLALGSVCLCLVPWSEWALGAGENPAGKAAHVCMAGGAGCSIL